jgi:hypothetical protein
MILAEIGCSVIGNLQQSKNGLFGRFSGKCGLIPVISIVIDYWMVYNQ